ncbi:MAG TPA: Sir2 family NAD-dependent protein deacetylase, partial [Brevundimonas sp.]|nr:Sir2 family NAD-dependent protein deacetylase [Brevundimonas sp.]
MAHRNLVILTGAGISAESGVPTFRADDGLWMGHRIEDVATPEAFARDPVLVQDFYNQRRRQLPTVHPNAAHRAIADLAARWRGDFLLVTQNVDDLHDRAHAVTPPAHGFDLIHMHGELLKAHCTRTGQVCDWPGDLAPDQPSPHHPQGRLRPHIVWFGETPYQMERIAVVDFRERPAAVRHTLHRAAVLTAYPCQMHLVGLDDALDGVDPGIAVIGLRDVH